VPAYAGGEFDRMVQQTSPERVIVTVPDHAHCAYIVRALELGADVITEKPLTVDAESCRRIVAAQQATGRSITVAFNYRYSPARSLLKQVLVSGIVGHVTAVNFEWQLDTYHGADYFRRWHRNKANSGGLFVHKATHHFDLLNWWLGRVPQRVAARGRRMFYRPETAEAFGLGDRGERCSACPAFERCRVKLNVAADGHLRALYADNEIHDGYFRDRCVFSSAIDIEDSMHATIEYQNGVIVNYLLTAYALPRAIGWCFMARAAGWRWRLSSVPMSVRMAVSWLRRCPSTRASSCSRSSAELSSSPCRRRKGCIAASTR
jgi:predicted dehydrogenase